jgi:hypothetical protein
VVPAVAADEMTRGHGSSCGVGELLDAEPEPEERPRHCLAGQHVEDLIPGCSVVTVVERQRHARHPVRQPVTNHRRATDSAVRHHLAAIVREQRCGPHPAWTGVGGERLCDSACPLDQGVCSRGRRSFEIASIHSEAGWPRRYPTWLEVVSSFLV